jgi:hypothetical protein
VDEEFTFVGDGINVDFLGVVDELGNDDGMVWRDVGGGREEVLQSGLVIDDIHGGSRQDV